MNGLLGRKLGMTNIFDANGQFVPVTVIETGPCSVLETKTMEKEGYYAVVLGYEDKKLKKVKKPEKGWFDKIKIAPKRVVKEIRLDGPPEYKVGDAIKVGMFKAGDYVDVSGTSKGKGFQGGVKRWGWKGGESGHGSMHHRAPGSIGASSYPSRVFKGQHLPGHMGNVRRTVQSLEIIIVDEENNTVAVRGSVPGARGTLLFVKYAKKVSRKDAKVESKDKK